MRTRKYKPKPDPNPKTNLNPKLCPKNPKVKLGLRNSAKLFLLYVCAPKTKSTSQARFKPEIFVNFRPEPDPKSPGRLTTLTRSLKTCQRICLIFMVRFDFLPLNQERSICRIAGAEYESIGPRPGRAPFTKH